MSSRPPSVSDFDPIPLADEAPTPATENPAASDSAPAVPTPADLAGRSPGHLQSWLYRITCPLLPVIHGLLIVAALGGLKGIASEYPPWRDDHPLYYHSALVTRVFLHESWTTAGYDPSFMAGYMKSAVFPSSSTLPELVFAAFQQVRPALLYKLYLLCAAMAPAYLILAACRYWLVPTIRGGVLALVLWLVYVWTDFPINYVGFGMAPYFLAGPLALAALGAFAQYLAIGGTGRYLKAAFLLSAAFLTHLTTAMVITPAASLAYGAAAIASPRLAQPGQRSGKLSVARHLGVFSLPLVVLAVNSFWLVPGILLASTKGPSDFAFVHPEGALQRLRQILTTEAPIEAVLLAAGIPGLAIMVHRTPVRGWALVGMAAAGFFWGYLAGSIPALDFLQPGRHTYVFYSTLAVASGATLDQVLRRIPAGPWGVDHLDHWVFVGLVLLLVRLTGYPLEESIRGRVWSTEPFLSSKPSPRMTWVIDQIKHHVQPGERLLYEEEGFEVERVPDPYRRGRLSGLLPTLTGVEVLGGPYLHASLATNFTQFGEGKLFGRKDWDRAHFERYAQLYGPTAILCHSPHARAFCKSHPDLIEIIADEGRIMLGRVKGFAGKCMHGSAQVKASPGRLVVSEMKPDLDGTIVLRYHSAPGLYTRPQVEWSGERHEDDPVPFIRLRPPAGVREVEILWQQPVWDPLTGGGQP